VAVTALQGTGYAVAVVWALSALLTARARERTPQWQVSCGALAAAVALSATRTAAGASQSSHDLLFAAATLASTLVIALWIHLLLAIPDGCLGSRPRQLAAAAGYLLAACGAAISLAAGEDGLSSAVFAICVPTAVVLALPAVRIRYAAAPSRDRERLAWTGIGAVLAATVAIAAWVLNLLVAWPAPVAPVAAAATVLVPLGLIAGDVPQFGKFGGRLLVNVLAVAGYTVAVAVPGGLGYCNCLNASGSPGCRWAGSASSTGVGLRRL
jgi:hypothetical protein